MIVVRMIISTLNILWRGVLMLWEVAEAVPIATAAIIVVVAVAAIFLIVGR